MEMIGVVRGGYENDHYANGGGDRNQFDSAGWRWNDQWSHITLYLYSNFISVFYIYFYYTSRRFLCVFLTWVRPARLTVILPAELKEMA